MNVDEPLAAAPLEPPVEGPPPDQAPVFHAPFIRPIEVVTVGTIVVLDQLTKFLVKATIPLYAKREIVPNFLDLTHVQNTGAAFGVLNAAEFPYKSGVMIGIATLALLAIALFGRQLGAHEKLSRYGLSFIIGGAFGNLIDRALAGYVVDFVDVYWGEAHCWAFNVADAAITVGAILVLLDMIGVGRQHASHPV
jgi:signal peptidase II